MNTQLIYVAEPVDWTDPDWGKIDGKIDENWRRLKECDRAARAQGTLVGRYITHPFADGQAVYQIIGELHNKVVIRVCTGLGDDWVLPAWGQKCTIKTDQARQFIEQREALERLFE